MMTDWTPTRAEGETILAAFTPRMGRRYANGRHTDHGAGAHKAVSVLSPQATPSLAKHGISLCEWQRDWDAAIWPHATAGFFKVKQNIPRIPQQAGLA